MKKILIILLLFPLLINAQGWTSNPIGIKSFDTVGDSIVLNGDYTILDNALDSVYNSEDTIFYKLKDGIVYFTVISTPLKDSTWFSNDTLYHLSNDGDTASYIVIDLPDVELTKGEVFINSNYSLPSDVPSVIFVHSDGNGYELELSNLDTAKCYELHNDSTSFITITYNNNSLGNLQAGQTGKFCYNEDDDQWEAMYMNNSLVFVKEIDKYYFEGDASIFQNLILPSKNTGTHFFTFIADNEVWNCGYGNTNSGGGNDNNQGNYYYERSEVRTDNTDDIVLVQIEMNHANTYVRDTSGIVYVKGDGALYSFANGTTTDQNYFTPINWFTDRGIRIIDVVVGEAYSGNSQSVLFLSDSGKVYSNGYDGYGQLGNGAFGNSVVANQIFEVQFPTGVFVCHLYLNSSQWGTSFAVDSTGQGWTWGYQGNYAGGLGSTTNQQTPVQIPGMSDVVCLASRYGGASNTGILRSNGTAWFAGYGSQGQNADGSNAVNTIFTQESTGRTDITNIYVGAATSSQTVVRTASKEILLCGYAGYKNLGDGTTTNRNILYKPNFGFQGLVEDVVFAGEVQYANIFILDSNGDVWVNASYNAYGTRALGHKISGNSATDNGDWKKVNRTFSDRKAIAIRGGGDDSRSWVIIVYEDGIIEFAGDNHYGVSGRENDVNALTNLEPIGWSGNYKNVDTIIYNYNNVIGAPIISSSSANNCMGQFETGETGFITLYGKDFEGGMTATVGGATVNYVDVVGQSLARVNVTATSGDGSYNVSVTTSNGSDTEVGGLDIYNASTYDSIVWDIVHAQITTTPNSIFRSTGVGWNSGAAATTWANIVPENTAFELSFTKVGTANSGLFGMNSNHSTYSYTDIDYSFSLYSTTTGINIYENGVSRGNYGAGYTASTAVLTIKRDCDGIVTYYVDGNLVYTSLIVSTAEMYPDVSIYNNNNGFENISLIW